MCGIVGYAGSKQAAPILLDGLSRLEYRGYDSAGLCVFSEGELKLAKSKGRLAVLRTKTENGATLPGYLGIGHTRWATHGAPSPRALASRRAASVSAVSPDWLMMITSVSSPSTGSTWMRVVRSRIYLA